MENKRRLKAADAKRNREKQSRISFYKERLNRYGNVLYRLLEWPSYKMSN